MSNTIAEIMERVTFNKYINMTQIAFDDPPKWVDGKENEQGIVQVSAVS